MVMLPKYPNAPYSDPSTNAYANTDNHPAPIPSGRPSPWLMNEENPPDAGDPDPRHPPGAHPGGAPEPVADERVEPARGRDAPHHLHVTHPEQGQHHDPDPEPGRRPDPVTDPDPDRHVTQLPGQRRHRRE